MDIKALFPGLILLLVFRTGSGLVCTVCNVTSSSADNPCQGISTSLSCQPNSVCISASYEVSALGIKTNTMMKSCVLDIEGKQCELIISGMRSLTPKNVDTKIIERDCYVCDSDYCNQSSRNLPVAALAAITAFCLRLII